MRDPRQTAKWRKVRARVLEGATICQVPGCLYPGEPLRHDAPKDDPLKASVDHLIPVSATTGWSEAEREAVLFDPRYLRPAHLACNSRRSAGKQLTGARQADPKSRNWGI